MRPRFFLPAALGFPLLGLGTLVVRGGEPLQFSGIYPHLATFNQENECGTGAVVPWAGRLWVISYAPHRPTGSTDKLYEITPDLRQIIRPESIGGTPANRMIHRESRQLFIGPYAIDAQGHVRVIPYARMYGRLTGNARHLSDPANKIYCATMEEGFYEVDVHSLAVKELWRDEQLKGGRHANLPGYHGKGFYSGQGRMVYANNGEHGREAQRRPDIPSGALVTWDGRADEWTLVRRNQFTEVTGPGGIYGNTHPETDPIWSIGWDHRSLILMLLDHGEWHAYRLPKASHSYDGAHGWNTEWPRIRDIGEEDLLMTMHGMFWRFPRGFSSAHSAGLAPRSTYLKVIGDFCRWRGRLVFGCDDTAKAEFLNQRRAKGKIAAPQSQSNLWFVEPGRLDHLGPVIGRGAVWLQDKIAAGAPSDPFLFSGFDRKGLHLARAAGAPARLTIEVDREGNGRWRPLRTLAWDTPYRWLDLSAEQGAWVRLRSDVAVAGATAWFSYANRDARSSAAPALFDGLAVANETRLTGGLIRARAGNERTLHYAAMAPGPDGPRDLGYYELGADLKLRRVDSPKTHAWLKENAAIPVGVLTGDAASVIFVNDDGRRYRLPKGDPAFDQKGPLGPVRVDREVATERDLFNARGTFYELPAENAGGFSKLRPVTTHNRWIKDYCSYRGLLVMSGVAVDAPADNPHLIRSDDGKTALWVGAIDDVWQLGKPRGVGGPWKDTPVKAGQPSDPYLMTGYDRKTLTLSHRAAHPVKMTVEVDLTGAGLWAPCRTFDVPAGKPVVYRFPEAFNACWVRLRTDADTTATALLVYE